MTFRTSPICRFAAGLGLLAAVGILFSILPSGVHCPSRADRFSTPDTAPTAAHFFSIADGAGGNWNAESTDDEQPLWTAIWTSAIPAPPAALGRSSVFYFSDFVFEKSFLVVAPRRGPPPFSVL